MISGDEHGCGVGNETDGVTRISSLFPLSRPSSAAWIPLDLKQQPVEGPDGERKEEWSVGMERKG